ncbi:MAG: sigma-70 family RNA polymerase sigma factor [Ruminococcus sp.]|nr:sigma-70 family RNA polymerase sigma factor [Ruminococcus sp.]
MGEQSDNAGDFARIYEATRQSALRFISSKCLNITDIEDIYQETYLRVLDAVKEGREIRDPEAFVIGTAKHCLSHWYTAAQRLRARISLSAGTESGEAVDIGDDTDIEGLVADRELLSEVFESICALPSGVQRIFYLHYFQGLSLPETASVLGISESKTTALLYKAVRQIRRKFRGRE